MSKRYAERVQKRKKVYLKWMDGKMVIAVSALRFNGEARDTDYTVQRTKAKN